MSLAAKLKKPDLSLQILIALLLGIINGLFFGEATLTIAWAGEVWIRLMQMVVIPYVTLSLISGIGSLEMSLAKTLALRGTLLLLLFWFISAAILVAMPLAFPAWIDASFLSNSQLQEYQAFNPVELYVPDNPFHSLANSIVPAVVLFSIILGVALIHTKGRHKLLESFDVLIEALTRVMKFIIKLTPLGIFSIVSVASGTLTLEELSQLEVYFVTYAMASILLTFGIIPMVISMFTPFTYLDVLRFSRSALLTGFVTQNILVTLPLLICKSNELFEKYRMDSEKNKHVVDVIIPVTFNFPLTGRLLALLFIPFTAWMSGSELGLDEYPELIMTGIFSLFAKAQVALNFLMDIFHIPHDLLYLYIPSSIFNGKFDTMVSVMNLFAFSLIISVSLSSQMKLNWLRIARYSLASLVLLIATVLATKFFLASFTEQTYQKDEMLMNMQFSGGVAGDSKVFDELPSQPRQKLSGLDDNLFSSIIDSGVLRVGYRSERVPLCFVNGSNDLVGFDVELLNSLGEELGVRVEYYPFEWDEFFRLLNENHLDIVPSVAFDTFNMVNVELSEPYLEGRLSFVTRDHKRHDFVSLEVLKQQKELSLAILGEPVFIANMQRRIERLLPDTHISVTPISQYDEFFALGEEVDALVEVDEIGAGLTLLHPEYAVVVPKNTQMNFPMSYAVPKGEKAFSRLLSKWLAVKKAHGRINQLSNYWIYGEGTKTGKRRWSIKDDVLGW